MHTSRFELTVLGSRGSIAVGGAEYSEFGGSTSCYMVRAGDETVFLDAGSGLLSAPETYARPPVILLSHLHLDHVIGLGMSPLLSQKDQPVSLYVPFCEDKNAAVSQLERVYSPPLWPVKLDELGAALQIRPLPGRFAVGELQIEAIPGRHPGGCMVFKLSCAGRSLVYASDYEHGAFDPELTAFCQGADLLLYDAQFDAAEYERKKGYGHSTAEKGLELMEAAGIRRLLLIHHDPKSTDSVLRTRGEKLLSDRASYAREGQVIVIAA
ncbi:MAG: MBL fold metallo-hydrolase [Oscillospiraceae bacterium]|nr:MBL fold metallo-hydrolase [Oscillospiraceae bacterium]